MATLRRVKKSSSVNPLLDEARKEHRKESELATEAYLPAIKVLREEKGFSWREIQEWLEVRGVKRPRGMLYGTYLRATREKGK